ncbi:putative RNA-directed DNA polymerase from transposon X-element-like protein, partial [Tribolium castaneum]
IVCRYTSVDWRKFTKHLVNNFGTIPPIRSTEEIDEAVQTFETKIRDAIASATRERRTPAPRLEISWEIRDLIRAKRRARRIAQRTGFPVDRAEANRLRWEVRKALSDFRNERWEAKLQSLTTEDNSVWRMSRVLRSDRKPLPPIHSENGIVFTDEEKAEAFALSMSRQCSLNLTNADLDHVEEIEDHVESIMWDSVGIGTIGPSYLNARWAAMPVCMAPEEKKRALRGFPRSDPFDGI